jgi:phospholipase C
MMSSKNLTAIGVSIALLSPYYAIASPTTPIEHVIVIVGENHTFDNLYGTYRPRPGQQVSNLLSKKIVGADGRPGPNFSAAAQQQAIDTDAYTLSPTVFGPYLTLPLPNTTYATGLPFGVPDRRYPNNLPNGPYQLTNAKAPYKSAYFGDPVHRFFQMWQMTNQGKKDLFTWVAITAAIGDQSNWPESPTQGDTQQGGEAMGFYNMQAGDAPVFKKLADHYAMSDNYHQSVMGGTGANFLALVSGDVAVYNLNGIPATPPANQIENPNPQHGTNNWYTQDGYSGGSYVNCADRSQPGVDAVFSFLDKQPNIFNQGNCAGGAYYLVNNYSLGYAADGTPKDFGQPNQLVLPPQTIPTIADALSAHGVSWKYYSGGRNMDGTTSNEYCGICDPLTGYASIMTTAKKANLEGMDSFYQDVQSASTLPAVSFIRPFESRAGHPANAKMPNFETFINNVVYKVQANPQLWGKTAILVTVDEGGGYYDSGYIQPIDFFGDGTRIPLLAISPWAKKGYVDHSYGDHASILKFIEKNWGLAPLSARSRDNLPNPITGARNAYVPANQPAITDLMQLFDFAQQP